MSKKYTKFDRSAVINLRDDIQLLLNQYAQETGIEFVMGKINFTPTNVSIKMEAKVSGISTLREQKISNALTQIASQYNMTLEETGGRQLVGYESRKYKYPFIYRDIKTGKMYKCNTQLAKTYFAKAAA